MSLSQELRLPGAERLWLVADALRNGFSFEEVQELSGIDPWFLGQIADIVTEEQAVAEGGMASLDEHRLWTLKRKGFSDARLAKVLGTDEESVRGRRVELGLSTLRMKRNASRNRPIKTR